MIHERADVVIIGGGIIGCSIAYHLAKLGITDVVLLERRQLCCGTTWHSVGSVAELRGNRRITELSSYSAELYRSLEAETGQATGYRRTGSIMLALNDERLSEMKRTIAMARAFGRDAEMISLADVRDRCPQVNLDGAIAGLYLPSDGRVNPVDTTQALAKGARMRGVRIAEETPVDALIVQDGAAKGVVTPSGQIRAEAVVLAGGMWSRDFAARYGVSLPLQAAEHFYAVTEPIESLQKSMPFIRVPDESTYYKEDSGKLLFGCLEQRAKPWALEGIPESFCFDSLPADLDHFGPILETALVRFPLLQDAGIQLFFNGPESFTPDGNALVGETPELANLFVACGMNTVGVMAGAGIGRALAEWVHDRRRPEGMAEYDVARLSPFQSGRAYLRDRTVEAVGVLYDLAFPNREYRSARDARRLPLHDRHLAAGAVMGARAGWEVPLVYAPSGTPPVIELGYGRPNWVPWAADEARAAESDVALFDLSASAKLRVSGSGAAACLDALAANVVPAEGAGPLLWLTRSGNIECRVTLARGVNGADLVLSLPGAERRHAAWIKAQGREHPDVLVTEMTSALAVFLLIGPQAEGLLASVGGRSGTVGYAPAVVVPVPLLDAAAWLVILPSEFSAHAFEVLEEAKGGRLRLGGAYALDALRIAGGRPSWPQDLDDTVSPLEAGLAAEIAWGKPDFVGRDALLKRPEGNLRTRLAHFTLQEDRLALYGQEGILRAGRPVGLVTSGAWNHRTGTPSGFGYVTEGDGPGSNARDGEIVLDVSGEHLPARMSWVGEAGRS